MVLRLIARVMAVALLGGAVAWQSQPPPPTLRQAQGGPEQGRGVTAAQQRPVFRGGTHFVRVDAYPTQDGRIVEGLEAGDFEIFEDGKPQKIDSFDFVRFDTFTPNAVRRDPSSQREGFDMAADPRYRVFVIFVDFAFSTEQGPFAEFNDIKRIQQPLVQFLNRMLGPQDLYGFLTSRNSVKDLVLGQKSTVTESQVTDLFRSSFIDRDEADQLDNCGNGEYVDALKRQHRADATYTALEGLVLKLGSLRQERKNIVLVSNELPRWRPSRALLEANGGAQPRVGITNGRIGTGDRNSVGAPTETFCAGEAQRLAMIDFDGRYGDLVKAARKENVTFYVITPMGLRAPTVVNAPAVRRATDDLVLLANETDGLAIVNTNDLNAGMKRIADDLAAYYVLGYYTTNTTFDGGLRNIKVRLKANGKAVRARRQYRAPTQAEIAALASSASGTSSTAAAPRAAVATPIETALTVLERASRPFAAYAALSGKQLTVVAELSAASIQAGRWKEGADVDIEATGANGATIATARGKIEAGSYAAAIEVPIEAGVSPSRITVRLRGSGEAPADDWVRMEPASGTLVGDAVAYRSASRAATRPVAAFEFARNERVRIEWPVLAPLDRRDVRLLDKAGKALPVELPLAEDPATHSVVVEMSLSGLGRGDYLIELTAGAGTVTEKRLIAIRIR
jgi:VWFA-related protein